MANLTVTIITPDGEAFKGEALSISSSNKEGPFDILPQHAPFITLIDKRLIIRQPERKPPLKLEIEQGIVRCRNNHVVIYLGLKADMSLAHTDPTELIRNAEAMAGRAKSNTAKPNSQATTLPQ